MKKRNRTYGAAFLTAAVMGLALTGTALAVDAEQISAIGGSSSQAVTVGYENTGTTEINYRVDVTWGSLKFTYKEGGVKTWNTATHEYTTTTDDTAGWEPESEAAAQITVANHSNAAINATVTFSKSGDAAAALADVTGALTVLGDSAEGAPSVVLALEDASKIAEGAFEDADQKTAILTLSGAPTEAFTDTVTIGTVTVAIADAE